MLALYRIRDDRLVPLTGYAVIPAETVWIGLIHPTPEEEAGVERLLGMDVPTREEMAEIEISSRLYRHDDALFSLCRNSTGGSATR